MPDRNALIAAARDAAIRNGIDPDIYVRQINQESGFNPSAVSPAGAQGIAQFMPGTARGLGLTNPFDPIASLDAGARHMAALLRNLGSYPLALAGYNAGGGAVKKYGGIPPYKETQNYVRAILGTLDPASVGKAAIPTAPTGAAPIASSSPLAQTPDNSTALALLALLGGNSRLTPYDELLRGKSA